MLPENKAILKASPPPSFYLKVHGTVLGAVLLLDLRFTVKIVILFLFLLRILCFECSQFTSEKLLLTANAAGRS